MFAEIDRDYLERRIREERHLAETATEPSAGRAHATLAQQYERELLSLGERASPATGGAATAPA